MLSRTIEMKRAGLLLGLFACGSSRPPAPAETKVAAPVASTPLDAAPAPDAHELTAAELGLTEPPPETRGAVKSADGWSGCIISVKELDAQLHKNTAPNTGELLAAWRIIGDRRYSTTSQLVTKLATAPTPGKMIATTGELVDRIDEREGAVESTDHVDVAIVASQVNADYDVTLSQQGMPYHDSTTRHFTVTVQRVHDINDCN